MKGVDEMGMFHNWNTLVGGVIFALCAQGQVTVLVSIYIFDDCVTISRNLQFYMMHCRVNKSVVPMFYKFGNIC